jgi:hypothetical protein
MTIGTVQGVAAGQMSADSSHELNAFVSEIEGAETMTSNEMDNTKGQFWNLFWHDTPQARGWLSGTCPGACLDVGADNIDGGLDYREGYGGNPAL